MRSSIALKCQRQTLRLFGSPFLRSCQLKNCCVLCPRFMRQFVPTKTFNTPSKTLLKAYKNNQTPTNPKNYRSNGLWKVFESMPQIWKLEPSSIVWHSSHRILFGRSIVMIASLNTMVSASPCRWGAWFLVWETKSEMPLAFSSNFYQCRESESEDPGSKLHRVHNRGLEMSPKRFLKELSKKSWRLRVGQT